MSWRPKGIMQLTNDKSRKGDAAAEVEELRSQILVLTLPEVDRSAPSKLLTAVSQLPADQRPPLVAAVNEVLNNYISRVRTLDGAAKLLDEQGNALETLKAVNTVLEAETRPDRPLK